MNRIDFYTGGRKLIGDAADVTIRKCHNEGCDGVEAVIDGQVISAVKTLSVKPVYPWPSITLEIIMKSLTIEGDPVWEVDHEPVR